MLATSALHLSGHHRRQIVCCLGTSVGVGRGDNYLAPHQGCTVGGPFVPTYMRWQVLSLSSRVQPIVKQKNVGTHHSASFVLNCTPQLLQHFTINSGVYCALGQNSTNRTSCLSENMVHNIFLVEKSAWTLSFSANQYASSTRTAVLIQVWYGTPMSRLL